MFNDTFRNIAAQQRVACIPYRHSIGPVYWFGNQGAVTENRDCIPLKPVSDGMAEIDLCIENASSNIASSSLKEEIFIGLKTRAIPFRFPEPEISQFVPCQPAVYKLARVSIVGGLGSSVGIATSAMPPQISVEFRADVPQLVNHGFELLVKPQILVARQVEGEDVEHLAAGSVEEPLGAELAAVQRTDQRPALETQGR